MEKVQGIGGIFFKAKEPGILKKWYEEQLGIEYEDEAAAVFHWRNAENMERKGSTVWSIFPENTKYFGDPKQQFMINYRVKNLSKMLEQLRQQGAQVMDSIEESEFGKFGWVVDPEGHRIELWEPPEHL